MLAKLNSLEGSPLTKGTEGKVWVFYDAQAKKQSKPLSLVHAQIVVLSALKDDVNRYFVWTPGWKDWKSLGDFLKTDQTYFAISEPSLPNIMKPPKAAPNSPQKEQVKSSASSTAAPSQNSARIDDDQLEAITASISASIREGSFTDVQLSNEVQTISHYPAPDFNGDEFDIKKVKDQEEKTQKINSEKIKESSDPSIEYKEKRTSTRLNLKIEVILMNKMGLSFRSHSKNISMGGTLLSSKIPNEFLNLILDVIVVNKFENDDLKKRVAVKGRVIGTLGDKSTQNRIVFEPMPGPIRNKLSELLTAYVDKKDEKSKKSA